MDLKQDEIPLFAPKKAVIVLILWGENGDRICLGRKEDKENGCLGNGSWVNPGGKIDPGEAPVDTCIREIREEAGLVIKPDNLEYCAIAYFHNYRSTDSNEHVVCHCPIFRVRSFEGQPKPQPTEKIVEYQWFPYSMIPYDSLMLSDRYWLPLLLRDKKKYEIKVHYEPKQSALRGPVVTTQVRNLPQLHDL